MNNDRVSKTLFKVFVNIVQLSIATEGKMVPLSPFRRMKTLRFSRAFLDDNEWHRLCIAWNGVTGVTKVYVDGVQDKSAEFGKYAVGGLLKDSLPGGGTLEVLQYTAR